MDKLTGAVSGHLFAPHKDSEMICWDCGFVIWKCDNDNKIIEALHQLKGTQCPKKWHGKGKPL